MATVDPAPTVEIEARELRAGDVLVTTTRTGRELERTISFVEHRPTRGAVAYRDEPGTGTPWTIPADWPLRIRPRT